MPPVVRASAEQAGAGPELRVVELSSGQLASLENAPASRCRDALLAAGLLTEVRASDQAEDPRGWILAVQELLQELTALEDQRDGLVARDDRLMIRDAPLWAWVVPLGLPLLGWWMSGWMSTTAGQILSVLLTVIVPVVVWSGGVVVLYGLAVRRRDARRAQLAQTKQDVQHTRAAMLEGAARILARDFVARAGSRLLVCTPSRARAAPERVEAWLGELERYKHDPPEAWLDIDFTLASPAG